MFADVVITKKAYELDRLFCYRVPKNMEGEICPDKRVIVPFGNYGKTEGIVFSVSFDKEDIKNIKEISEVIDHTPVITQTGFKIASFLRKKYLCSYFDALKLNMPSGIKTFVDEKIYLADFDGDIKDEEELVIEALTKYNGCSYSDLNEKLKLKGLKALLLE